MSNVDPREDLISTAITFLTNPNVKRSPLNQKQGFLRSKGLNENEIQIACERAGVFTNDPNLTDKTIINIGHHSQNLKASYPQTLFEKIKEILSTAALISGLSYAIYIFYKRFIEPILFGSKKKKTVEETLNEINTNVEKKLKDLNEEIVKIREDLYRNTHHDGISRDIRGFKNDLDVIKGLLLHKKQFSSPLQLIEPPSIPQWQLAQSQSCDDTENDKNETGSGSGSSETEVVTKNSDSSLEIM